MQSNMLFNEFYKSKLLIPNSVRSSIGVYPKDTFYVMQLSSITVLIVTGEHWGAQFSVYKL